ncbi:hypothetical protein [Variovorax guangxiensis]|uniref:Uncharacterized protein n=1 Tax=Variovorax guangxiensis TaxID=1775474 RepID=A0A840FV58_9BURK|nr:hypothetical protein [Variovorax guangxiensis]MBB4226093.1 hypothetical protein [Variovorax guangxiensis]
MAINSHRRIARKSEEDRWNARLEICIPRVLDGLVYPEVYPENRVRDGKRLLARAAQDFSIQPQLDRGNALQTPLPCSADHGPLERSLRDEVAVHLRHKRAFAK